LGIYSCRSLGWAHEFTTAPNRQAAHTRQLCAAMDEMEERIRKLFEEKLTTVVTKLEDLSMVKEQLADVNTKLFDQASRLEQVQTKVDLAMTSLGTVQQEQQQVARALKTSTLPKLTIPGRDTSGLMGSHPRFPPPPPPQSSLGVPDDSASRRPWLPKMEFPRFDGTDARIWIDKCTAYFAMFQIPDGFRVTAATMYLDGRAAHWFQAYKDSYGVLSWDEFQSAVLAEFDVTSHREKIMELLTLKQIDTVEDYKKSFEQLVYHIRLYDKTISEPFLITQFVLGLKEELRAAVEIQLPDTVTKAATLAAIQEGLLLRQKKPFHKLSSPKSYTLGKSDSTAPPQAGELWKARQLKEYRKLNGLCFKCGEKFTPGHKCKQPTSPTLNYIAVEDGGDGGIMLSDEVLELLESPQSLYAPEDVFVSLNAISGADKPKLIQFRALACNQVVLQLLDTGSSHTFINAGLLAKVPCNVVDITPMEVRVANEQTLLCSQAVKDFSWWVQVTHLQWML